MIDWGFVAILEFVFFIVMALVFATKYAFRSKWWTTPIGRLQLALFLMLGLVFIGFVAMAFVTVPSWPFAVIGFGLDAVAVGFVVQLGRAQRDERRVRESVEE